jgi:hypothetical protein
MDMEKLNKSQIVLLTLLVSFMTSIATGIVTVTLMEQAPQGITEVVNRVVERTVERVVSGQSASAAGAVETKTVFVKESEIIPQAVEAVAPSIIRIYSSSSPESAFLGIGIVLDTRGTILVDSSAIEKASALYVQFPSGKNIALTEGIRNDAVGLAYLHAATSTDSGALSWKPATFVEDKPVLGQTVILISGRSDTRVRQGLITSLLPSDAVAGGTPSIIETDLSKDVIMPGSPIINTSGQVLGVSAKASRASSESGFLLSSIISGLMKEKPIANP